MKNLPLKCQNLPLLLIVCGELRNVRWCWKIGRMLLCVRERSTGDSHNHSSLQRQFSHGHSPKSEAGGSGSETRISHFLPTSRRIVQFSNGKVHTYIALNLCPTYISKIPHNRTQYYYFIIFLWCPAMWSFLSLSSDCM